MMEVRRTAYMTLCLLCMAICLATGFEAFSQKAGKNHHDLQLLSDNVFNLSEIMLRDVANPPAASRFYAYAMLGAYEAAFHGKGGILDIHSKLNDDPGTPSFTPARDFNLSLCANFTMLEVGRQIMPSGYLLEEKQKEMIRHFRTKKKLSEKTIEENIRYAREIAGHVLQYAKSDGYNKLSTYTRYTPSKEEGRWYPTPPEYMAAVEPQWKTVRPFFLDSASQLTPDPPAPFSKEPSSAFYKQMTEVYQIVNNITDKQRDIANFWDCNPFAVAYSGHMAIGLKKISPGGHWMGITGIACKKAGIPLDSAILIHTVVAMTLHDAFITCWQEKFSSDRIRPEAAINKLLDPSWRPVLQTPPFPEYTSGHSVVSAAVATVLTYLLGDNFEFIDTSEVYFGLPERKFNSFQEAADEAAISRLYGGIHFRDACEQGVLQGKRVGQLVLKKSLHHSTRTTLIVR